MPYDYPGEYAFRFEGEADVKPSAFFKRVSGVGGFLLRPSPAGPLQIQDLTAASPRGGMLLQQWCKATSPAGGPPKNLVIEVLNRAGQPVARWRVRNARPVKWMMKSTTGRAAQGQIAIETLEIAHEGMRPG